MRQTEQNAAKFHVYLNLDVFVVPSAAECFAFLFLHFPLQFLLIILVFVSVCNVQSLLVLYRNHCSFLYISRLCQCAVHTAHEQEVHHFLFMCCCLYLIFHSFNFYLLHNVDFAVTYCFNDDNVLFVNLNCIFHAKMAFTVNDCDS